MTPGIAGELLAGTPRPVRRRAEHGSFLTPAHLFTVPHTLVGVALIGWVVLCALHLAIGYEADAHVVETTTYESKGKHWQVRYILSGDGWSETDTTSMSHDPKFKPGDPLRVNVVALGGFHSIEVMDASPEAKLLLSL